MHAHPDIHGSNAELHFWDTGNFTEDFGSWLYRTIIKKIMFLQKNLNLNSQF